MVCFYQNALFHFRNVLTLAPPSREAMRHSAIDIEALTYLTVVAQVGKISRAAKALSPTVGIEGAAWRGQSNGVGRIASGATRRQGCRTGDTSNLTPVGCSVADQRRSAGFFVPCISSESLFPFLSAQQPPLRHSEAFR